MTLAGPGPASAARRRLRILWLATKPAWPPVDGGRLLSQLTLEALAKLGHRVTLVAPVDPDADRRSLEAALGAFCDPHLVPARPRGRLADLARSMLRGLPYSVERHRHAAVRQRAAWLLHSTAGGFDVVHVEQLQALSHLPVRWTRVRPAAAPDRPAIPVVLRAQNVESDLWSQAAAAAAGVGPWLLRRQARLLARFEAAVAGRVDALVTLTKADADRLVGLGSGQVAARVVPAPFPARLPAAAELLSGEPPLALFGSSGWLPNEDGLQWFAAEIWPRLRRELPGVELHLFGSTLPEQRGLVCHPRPPESRTVFAPNATLIVPLRIASGVRMRILESWARGVPVIATPEATAGLAAVHRRELLVADRADRFLAAVRELGEDRRLRARLRSGGYAYLEQHHAPERVARTLVAIYRQSGAGPGPGEPES